MYLSLSPSFLYLCLSPSLHPLWISISHLASSQPLFARQLYLKINITHDFLEHFLEHVNIRNDDYLFLISSPYPPLSYLLSHLFCSQMIVISQESMRSNSEPLLPLSFQSYRADDPLPLISTSFLSAIYFEHIFKTVIVLLFLVEIPCTLIC